jgi:hypothetical protein
VQRVACPNLFKEYQKRTGSFVFTRLLFRPLWVSRRHRAAAASNPLYPRKRTCAVQQLMSAMGQKQKWQKN